MQRTIRLSNDDGFRLNANGLEVFEDRSTTDYETGENIYDGEFVPTRYAIGAQAVLVSRTSVSPDALRAGSAPRYHLHFDPTGVPGNSDPTIKRTTGWRGTTNDVSVDAHGIVTIRKIRRLKNGDIAVTVS